MIKVGTATNRNLFYFIPTIAWMEFNDGGTLSLAWFSSRIDFDFYNTRGGFNGRRT